MNPIETFQVTSKYQHEYMEPRLKDRPGLFSQTSQNVFFLLELALLDAALQLTLRFPI